MTAALQSSVGGASTALLDATASAVASSVSIADVETREAFLDAWAKTLSEHAAFLRANKKSLAAPVVVAFVPDTGAFCKQAAWRPNAMLGASPRDEFSGMLIAATGEVGGCSPEKTFTQTSEFASALASNNLGNCLTVGLITESKILVWPEGVESIDAKPYERAIGGKAQAVDVTTIQVELHDFYMLDVRQSKRLWKDSANRIAVDRAEGKIQDHLWIYLVARMSNVARIKQEEEIGNGRADITIYPIDSNAPNQSAVLELKTIRQVMTPKPGKTELRKITHRARVRWIRKGLQQSEGYRVHNKMDAALVCLYDFCEGNTDAVINDLAPWFLKYNVMPLRYWVTASNDEAREDSVPIPADSDMG
jgi:hypothetical protein